MERTGPPAPMPRIGGSILSFFLTICIPYAFHMRSISGFYPVFSHLIPIPLLRHLDLHLDRARSASPAANSKAWTLSSKSKVRVISGFTSILPDASMRHAARVDVGVAEDVLDPRLLAPAACRRRRRSGPAGMPIMTTQPPGQSGSKTLGGGRRVARRLEDDVGAPAVGLAHDYVAERRLRHVDGVIGPRLAAPARAWRSSTSRDDDPRAARGERRQRRHQPDRPGPDHHAPGRPA